MHTTIGRTLWVFIALLGAATAQGAGMAQSLTPITAGGTAPELHLQNTDGTPVTTGDFRGKVLLINFWATWCPPCREEMPSLERLHQATRDQGVVILAPNVGEPLETVLGFAESLDPAPSFPLLLGAEFDTLEAWRVRGLPTTLVIAPDGSLAYKAEGGVEFDHPEVVRQLRELAGAPDR